MASPLKDWTRYLAGLSRDLWFEWTGNYRRARLDHPTKYLSPTGLALSCDAFGGVPWVASGRLEHIDLSTYRGIKDGAVIWLRIEALPLFNREVLPHLNVRFVLVTGESDWSVPSHFYWAARTVIGSGKLIHWFSVNYDGTDHADWITPVPLGFDYPKKNEITLNRRQGSYRVAKKPPAEHEAAWEEIERTAPPLAQRSRLAFADFHFNDSAYSRRFGETRTEICERLRDNPNIFWPARRDQDPLAPRRRYVQHAFIIVAYGRGLDGHRAWEALMLGCIIIVKKGPLDLLYRGLPVVSIAEWEEITAENMARWFAEFGPGYDRSHIRGYLSLDHWMQRIRAVALQGAERNAGGQRRPSPPGPRSNAGQTL